MPFCDFCSADRSAAWVWPARDIDNGPEAHSLGGWAACEECHRLLEARDRQGLLNRAVRVLRDRWGPLAIALSGIHEQIGIIHDRYWEARIDEPPRPVK